MVFRKLLTLGDWTSYSMIFRNQQAVLNNEECHGLCSSLKFFNVSSSFILYINGGPFHGPVKSGPLFITKARHPIQQHRLVLVAFPVLIKRSALLVILRRWFQTRARNAGICLQKQHGLRFRCHFLVDSAPKWWLSEGHLLDEQTVCECFCVNLCC